MSPASETSPSVRVADLRSPALAHLGLRLITGQKGLDRPIDWPRVQKPGLAIAGFLAYVKPNRVQILGNSELSYLKTLSPAVVRQRLDAFTALPLSGVVVTKGILLMYVGRKVDLALISGYARHILRLPLRFFETRQVGEILSRVNDTAKVREAVSGTTTTAVVDGTLVAVLLAVLWLYDLPLALVATGFAPLLVLSVMVHHPASKRAPARPWSTPPRSSPTWWKTSLAWTRSRPTARNAAEGRKVKLASSGSFSRRSRFRCLG